MYQNNAGIFIVFRIWLIRRQLCILITGLLVAISWWPGQTSARSKHAVRDISTLLEQGKKVQGLPAVAAVVIQRDKIVAQGVVGVRKLGQPERARIDDRWHLGSDTKAITATMIGVLVEQGRLSPHLATRYLV